MVMCKMKIVNFGSKIARLFLIFCHQNNFLINVNCMISYCCLRLKLGKINKITDSLSVEKQSDISRKLTAFIDEMISYLE